MKQLLSPKQVARSIGVSESSLKRWCDQGELPFEKTPGGHRKIRSSDVVQFLRKSGHRMLDPEALGLPANDSKKPESLEALRDGLVSLLSESNSAQVRQLILQQYLSGTTAVEICDKLLCPVMVRIGECWDCGDLQVFQERNACEILDHVLHEIRGLIPPPDINARLAIGGSAAGDNYRLPARMVQLALAEQGWTSISLGNNLPWDTLAEAAKRHMPALFWISLSNADDLGQLSKNLAQLANELPKSVAFAIGGRLLPEIGEIDSDREIYLCDTLSDLLQLGLLSDEERSAPFA